MSKAVVMSVLLPHQPPRLYLARDIAMGLPEVMWPGIPLMEVQSKCSVCYVQGVENAGDLNLSAQDFSLKAVICVAWMVVEWHKHYDAGMKALRIDNFGHEDSSP